MPQFNRTDEDENNLILTLIINKMRKVLVANISSKVSEIGSNVKRNDEFELTELNKHLTDGWKIEKYDIVTNQSTHFFSIIYQLAK